MPAVRLAGAHENELSPLQMLLLNHLKRRLLQVIERRKKRRKRRKVVRVGEEKELGVKIIHL